MIHPQRVFLIACLPRSRSAWLANLFTYGDVFCYHEIARQPGGLDVALTSTGRRVVGSAGSDAIVYADRVFDLYPDARMVLIDRDWGDVAESLIKVGIPPSHDMTIWWAAFKEKYARFPLISYTDIDLEVCKFMCDYLTGAPLDEQRFHLLESLNVQADLSNYEDTNLWHG